MVKNNFRSPEEKQRLIAQVKTLRAQGKTLEQACAQAKIQISQFYDWSQKLNGRKPQKTATKKRVAVLNLPMVSEAPAVHTKRRGTVAVVFCRPEDVRTIIGDYQ